MRLVALADRDVLGTLPITDPQFLPLILKVELMIDDCFEFYVLSKEPLSLLLGDLF